MQEVHLFRCVDFNHTKKTYFGVFVHYADEYLRCIKFLLDFVVLDKGHSGQALADAITAILEEWELTDSVSSHAPIDLFVY